MIHITPLCDPTLLAEVADTADESVLSDWYPGVFLVAVIVIGYAFFLRRRRKKESIDSSPSTDHQA